MADGGSSVSCMFYDKNLYQWIYNIQQIQLQGNPSIQLRGFLYLMVSFLKCSIKLIRSEFVQLQL